MTEYAPQAITDLFNAIRAGIPSALMAGIIGDSAHTYGYHRGRDFISSSDYSVSQATPPDKKGSGQAACALDISWSKASDQYTVSQRLLNAKNDARMKKCVREFYGSTDGRNVCGWDYWGGYAVTSDDSHLWHIHLSILREFADDFNTLKGVADVITGGTTTPIPEEPEMKYTSTDTHNTHKLTKGKWVTLYNKDDNSQTFATGPGSFMAQQDLSLTGLKPGAALHVRFFQEDTKSGSTTKRVTSYPQQEIIGTSGGSAGRVIQFGSMGTPAKGWTRRLKAEAYPDDDGVSYDYSAARTHYY